MALVVLRGVGQAWVEPYTCYGRGKMYDEGPLGPHSGAGSYQKGVPKAHSAGRSRHNPPVTEVGHFPRVSGARVMADKRSQEDRTPKRRRDLSRKLVSAAFGAVIGALIGAFLLPVLVTILGGFFDWGPNPPHMRLYLALGAAAAGAIMGFRDTVS